MTQIPRNVQQLLREIVDTHARIAGRKLHAVFTKEVVLPKIKDNTIYLPERYTPAIPDERSAVVYAERELFKLHANSDGRNVEKLESKHETIKHAANAVWNIAETHRVESFVSDLLHGTGIDVKEFNKRLIPFPPTSAIEALLAIKYGREDLVQGTEFEEIIGDVKELLSQVEKKSVKATHAVSEKLIQRLRKFNLDHYEPPSMSGGGEGEESDESEEKEESDSSDKKQSGKGKSGGKTGKSDDSDKDEDSDKDSESKEEQESDGEDEQEGEGDESEEEGDGDGDGESSEEDEEKDESEGGSGGGEAADDKLDKDAENLKDNSGIDYDEHDTVETSRAKIPEKDLEKMLEDAEKEGKEELEKLREKFESSDGVENRYRVHVSYELDENSVVVKKDVIPTVAPFKVFDQTTASILTDFFRQIRGKAKHTHTDSGNIVNIQGMIDRMAGDSTDELFTKKVSEHGLTIAFCIDLSGSVGAPIKFTDIKSVISTTDIPEGGRDDFYRYDRAYLHDDQITKITAAKFILMTLYEATRELRDVKVRMYAANGGAGGSVEYKGESVYTYEAAEIDRERIETISAWGGSDGHPALFQAVSDLKDETGKKLMIYIADDDDSAWHQTAQAIQLARDEGIVPFTIMLNAGGGTAADDSYIVRKWAKRLGEPHKDFEIINDMADAQQIITELCTEQIMAAIMQH